MTIDTIPNKQDVFKYATDVAHILGIGKRHIDNGLFILISKEDKKIAFATGYGTEEVITDSICKSLINNTIIPSFKKQRFYEGVRRVLDSIKFKWID